MYRSRSSINSYQVSQRPHAYNANSADLEYHQNSSYSLSYTSIAPGKISHNDLMSLRTEEYAYRSQEASFAYPQSISTVNQGRHPYSINLSSGSLIEETNLSAPASVLLVMPGKPTPVALCSYENKLPTGFLHVTKGNQTVEFLDGVANLPLASA